MVKGKKAGARKPGRIPEVGQSRDPKRKPKTGGRKRGTPNKLTLKAKAAFEHAFAAMGGQQQLAIWATENQTEFYKLFARLIPFDVGIAADASLADLLTRLAASGE